MEAGRLHPAAIWSDLRTFDARAWRGAVDCVLSGDPCQGNSVAGKRLGAADDRWLLDRAIEVFDHSGASTFFRENVVGNLDGQLAAAIPALERLGCRVAVGIFSAAEAGASHRRERFFILAHREGGVGRVRGGRATRSAGHHANARGGSRALDDAERAEWRTDSITCDRKRADADARQWDEGAAWSGASSADLGDADSANAQGWWGGRHPGGRKEPLGYAGLAGGSVEHAPRVGRREGWPEHAGQQGRSAFASASGAFPAFAPGPSDPRWPDIIAAAPSLEPAVCRMADGMAGRIERLRHCGNGVVPLAAALAWVRLHGLLADDAAGDAVRFADDRTAEAGELLVRAA